MKLLALRAVKRFANYVFHRRINNHYREEREPIGFDAPEADGWLKLRNMIDLPHTSSNVLRVFDFKEYEDRAFAIMSGGGYFENFHK